MVTSKCNNIEIGVVGQGYQLEKGITCKESVVYHLADGKVLSGIYNKQGSEWMRRGVPLQKKTNVIIEVRVDPGRHTVAWMV